MKRIIHFMGAALIVLGLLQPITNVPEAPVALAEPPKSTKAIDTVKNIELKSSETPTAQVALPKPVHVADDGSAKAFIYMHESGGRTDAINPSSGACGLGQALPCSKMPCTLQDYACQDSYFTQYMLSRYGSWENARAFWVAHSWW